jgi:hypothetical protein
LLWAYLRAAFSSFLFFSIGKKTCRSSGAHLGWSLKPWAVVTWMLKPRHDPPVSRRLWNCSHIASQAMI